jgi:type VI secretion system secreted protein VgrG
MERRVILESPLGAQLQFRRLLGQEKISELFEFDIDAVSERGSIDPHQMLGQHVSLRVETDGGGERYLDGVVTRFGMQGMDQRKNHFYKMRVKPWLWLASRKSDFRIFQFMTVPDIIAQVLQPYGHPFEMRLSGHYREWEYCVQYDESDAAYVMRLMEHEGIYFYHTHELGQHTLVLADDVVGSHQPIPGAERIIYYPAEILSGGDEECIYAWSVAQEIDSGRHYNDDYDFKKPLAELSNMRQNPPGHAHDAHEHYMWPGGYTEFGDGENYARINLERQLSPHTVMSGISNHRRIALGHTFHLHNYPREDQNQQYLLTSVHYEFEENARVSQGRAGKGTAQGAQGTPVAQIAHSADPSDPFGATVGSPLAPTLSEHPGSVQRIRINAHPTSRVYRPQRKTTKPRPHTQTAVVVGPPGEEIWVDEFGRIKVQFHWDRIGAFNEHSSCWIRVSQPWAGTNFGGVFLPRIGQEVMVDFINGDIDYPIVTGRVYNAMNMPPWRLPANATQSGFLTRSSKGGAPGPGMRDGPGDANAIRFEDKKGAEQLWIHAQLNQLTEVEHDEDKWVGHDRRKTIDRDETNVIHRDRTETVDNNEKITVHNNRDERVDHNETVSIGDNWSQSTGQYKTESVGIGYTQTTGIFKVVNMGVAYNVNVGATTITHTGLVRVDSVGDDWSRTVGKNRTASVGENEGLSVGKDRAVSVACNDNLIVGETLKIKARKIEIGADEEIIINCGASTIRLTPAVIEVLSPLDKLNC